MSPLFRLINHAALCVFFAAIAAIAADSVLLSVQTLVHASDIMSGFQHRPHGVHEVGLILYFKFFVIITLFVIGCYNIVIYFMRRKDRAPFFFGLFSIILAVNTIISTKGYWFIQAIFGHFPPEFQVCYKLDIMTTMLCIPVFVHFLHAFYPEECHKGALKLFWIISVFYILIVPTLSVALLEKCFNAYFPVICMAIAYSIYISINALFHKRHDARGIFAGIIAMSIAGINDILWGLGVHTIILLPLATIFFIMIYSLIISRRFARAFAASERLSVQLIENQRLRDEMQVRIRQEQDSRQIQRRLTELMHVIDEALCIFYETGEIVFCNRAFEEITGYKEKVLIGKFIDNILKFNILTHNNETMEKLYKNQNIIDSKGNTIVRDVLKISMELEDEQLFVIVLKTHGIEQNNNISIVSVIDALYRNRARIHSLEQVMINATQDVFKDNSNLGFELKMIDKNLEHIENIISRNSGFMEEKKIVGSEILNLCIQYWIECTKKNKLDFARESNLWKVNINRDGWERAQTLDRYLDVKTFPKIPRWNQITETADFILLRCKSNSTTREKLESLLNRFYLFS
jgi:PAS domain S-box-containing protein